MKVLSERAEVIVASLVFVAPMLTSTLTPSDKSDESSRLRMASIGLGSGQLEQMLVETIPQLELNAVELDGTVVNMVKDHFFFNPLPSRLMVHTADGLEYVEKGSLSFS